MAKVVVGAADATVVLGAVAATVVVGAVEATGSTVVSVAVGATRVAAYPTFVLKVPAFVAIALVVSFSVSVTLFTAWLDVS